ncbi:MAG: VCBS repeat-containing protein [Ignavibacteria bacterium]|nr:VCBS repeat-containing protein [Ignavibacteria bacterium]
MKINIYFIISLITIFSFNSLFGKLTLIPVGSEQKDFLRAYRFALHYSHADLRFTNNTMDSIVFPKYGEFSIYWIKTGPNQGSFVYPDILPKDYSDLTTKEIDYYDWKFSEHFSLQFKHHTQSICIFQSEFKQNNSTVSWSSFYFKNLLDMNFFDNIYFFANEKYIDSIGFSLPTRLLIIPSFRKFNDDDKYFIDKIVAKYPNLKRNIDGFLSRGGTIYVEGNAVYLLEKLGYLPSNSVDFKNYFSPNFEDNSVNVRFTNSNHPLNFTKLAVDNKLYASTIPTIKVQNAEVIAYLENTSNPVVFVLSGVSASNGQIIVNTGLPTVGGMNDLKRGSRQLQWTLNAIFSAYCSSIDLTRSVYNNLPKEITAGANAISYDRLDTFEVRLKIRNLGSTPFENVSINEYVREYFKIIGVRSTNINYSITGTLVNFKDISLSPFEEKEIVLLISTPEPQSKVHEQVDRYIAWANYIYVSYCEVRNQTSKGLEFFVKYRNYVDLMFSARLIADTDLNWKNILYLDYQPFKVFTIIENKERTAAVETKYIQYIPKDVPFYRVDKKINIPILKTPGGRYIDILRGSNNQSKPEYDMDSDGYPDVWLDTSSIYPKGYTIEETEIYWINPWEHFRTGDTSFYEDIDNDGLRARDINGDGTVDIEEPGDKIRVWKVTWNIGKVAGYEYFDPYCYYEIWLDPPDLVNLSAGVAKVYGKLDEDVPGMFYPYSPDINKANIKDERWKRWMEIDKNGNPIWKQFIYQRIQNYEGFTFIDTLKENYKLKLTDKCIGTVPQPHREFIAVLSLGGREIDMNSPTPSSSQYSNLIYKTIFNETRVTPIRTTYTYYTPLPNPLQFEYLTNSFKITDTTGTIQYQTLPKFGKALIHYTMDASTEYSYYWIRNAGHDVDYNDPSEKIEGVEKLGDGVFGYLIYDIPKGIGGYKITLPKKPDGSYDIDRIVQIDGKPFQKWLDNPNTKDKVEIIEDAFLYHIYIPQILIPPALDDDNNDGKDDWIDDRGDRFQSSTGFLHDAFMLGNGEDYPDWPKKPFQDDIYGKVKSGWYPGPDNTYGDDKFEKLGKTRINICAIYEGLGREGSLEISKGGWLVVEEIFGGSPWVITSHTLSGFAIGTNVKLTSRVQPSSVRYGLDTTFLLHFIEDVGEPHSFDINFDPYHISYGYGDIAVTTYSGGRDPCNLISPNKPFSNIVDANFDKRRITLIPFADSTNPNLKGYPKQIEGTFIQIRIEVNNSTDYNFINTRIEPQIPTNLGKTELVFKYVAYPRPLVPAKFDPQTGKVVQGGDDFGTLRTGWRFNQPEGEMLVSLGNSLSLLQPGRRAYFIYLFKLDSSLTPDVYSIKFYSSGDIYSYTGEKKGNFNYEIPSVLFSVAKKKVDGTVTEYQKFVLGQSNLKRLEVQGTNAFKGINQIRWSDKSITYLDFDTLKNKLSSAFDSKSLTETIDLSIFKDFPTKNFTKFYVLEKVEVNSSNQPDKFKLTESESLVFDTKPFGENISKAGALTVSSVGPKVTNFKRISALNGEQFTENESLRWKAGKNFIEVSFYLVNIGSDIAENVTFNFAKGKYFLPTTNQNNVELLSTGVYKVVAGSLVPGEMKEIKILFETSDNVCSDWFDESTLIQNVNIYYNGPRSKLATKKEVFSYVDNQVLSAYSSDIFVRNLRTEPKEIKANEEAIVKWEIGNGLIPINKPVKYELFAIVNLTDTISLANGEISSLAEFESKHNRTQFLVSDSIFFLEFLLVLDKDNVLYEICKGNNSKLVSAELVGPNWMRKVSIKPNPFDYYTEITYVISQDISRLDAFIFALDGSFVGKIENCPSKIGINEFTVLMPNLAKGTYLVRFEGITPENEKVVNYVKLVKEK